MQTEEQRQVLDAVSHVGQCGLDNILSLPQLVVCGDQSAGKSSVLEALTDITFPTKDSICTRFATEIHLRRENKISLAIKVIPGPDRILEEQDKINVFKESINDFLDLPRVMKEAMYTMDIRKDEQPGEILQAFFPENLSNEVCGTTQPQLALVDIPGLIATHTSKLTEKDVELVAVITDRYISMPRTICLAVVSAKNDINNQKILAQVRKKFYPRGERTLGMGIEALSPSQIHLQQSLLSKQRTSS
ncbi:P-loop containing nucleoside triphosphate hydrolase protein [Calycina marina]|uniref:P-loop containing nucleoside triphosphate hydrolase protein n=1 Tax=Calycina marina TaxID=1763456 RepID=A0A9P7YXU3_9HELO|nr:P-loop containing nucleoside triphosphate hydrolase protein [Calycina marina]